MWVYPSDEVRTSPETTALLPQLPAESGTPKQSVPEPLNAGEAMPDGVAQQPERLHRRMRHASRDCCLLAAAFLLGTAAAGALQAVCDASQQGMLSYFLQCWCGLFSVSAPTSAAGLFCAEYAALAVAATLLLLLGLSAVGPVCIFLFTMLYGLGNGLLSAQMLAGADGKSILALLLLGIPAACAAGRLCRRRPVHVRCSSTAGERAHPGLLLPKNGRTSLFRGAGTDGAVSAGDRGIFAAVRRSDRARLSGRKNPLTSAFLAMPPRVCYNKENG